MAEIEEFVDSGYGEACVIAVCTYKRPVLLRSAAKDILAQDFSAVTVPLHLLIVDNDPDQTARQIYDEIASDSSWLFVHYLQAQPQGLVVARNVALDFAKDLRATLIFIDDDEIPDDGWLASFWEMHAIYPGDVIAGPVLPKFEEPLPHWCQDGSYWMRETFEDGALLPRPTGDGNILYPSNFVSIWRYSLKYNTSGAQDTHLLRRWISSGGGLRWSANATVKETVPAGRMTFTYAMDRAYFSSLAYVWVDREMGSTAAWTLLRAVRRLGIGIIGYVAARLKEDVWGRHRALLHFSSARGTFDGLRLKAFDRYADYQIDVKS